MIEIYKPITGFEQKYSVSNLGNVKNIITGKILKPRNTGKGYLIVTLYKNDSCKNYKVHRLVAEMFIGKNDLHIDHIDMNRSNNKVENLRYCTPRQNKNYSIDKSLTSSKYTGVVKRKNKWISQCTKNGKAKYLGMFNCEFSAYVAYVKAIK